VSQPDAVVPTTSKTPISASRPAAVTCVIPWSCAAGIRCVETRPFVVAPQTKNVPASSQKARERIAAPSASIAAPKAGAVATGGGCHDSSAP
jgi:hypothetical protein